MLLFIERIANDRIQAAQHKGEFENLEGTGRPLDLEDDSMIPPDLRMAYKILKNADCLPPQLAEEKDIRSALDLLADMHDEQERYRQMQKLDLMIARFNERYGKQLDLEQHKGYYRQVVERMAGNKDKQL